MFHFLCRSTIQNSEDTDVGRLNGKKPLYGNWNLRQPKHNLILSTFFHPYRPYVHVFSLEWQEALNGNPNKTGNSHCFVTVASTTLHQFTKI